MPTPRPMPRRSTLTPISMASSRRSSQIRFLTLQLEAFIEPASNATGHQLHRAIEAGQPYCCTAGAITVRTAAIDNEQRVLRPLRHAAGDDLGMRQADCGRNVSTFEGFVAAHVKQDEVLLAAGDRDVNVPAVSLEAEFGLEVS